MLSLSRANYKDVTFTAKKMFLQLILKPRAVKTRLMPCHKEDKHAFSPNVLHVPKQNNMAQQQN